MPSRISKKRIIILLALAWILVAVPLSFGGWWIWRQVNYSFLYESMVRDTIKEMVRPEALKADEETFYGQP